MVEADFSGDYCNAENTQDGDILTIVAEATYGEITRQTGEVKKVLNVPVAINGVNKIYTPSRDCGKAMVKSFGKDTKDWIGKKIQAKLVNYKSFGITKQTIDCYPIE